MFKRLHPISTLILFFAAALPAVAADLTFAVSFPPTVRKEPFTGRIIFFFGDKDSKEPRLNYSWTSRRPVFAQNVRDMQPCNGIRIHNPDGFPFTMKELPAGTYTVQAVMHTNLDLPHSGNAPGNLYSKPVTVEVIGDEPRTVNLLINKKVPPDTRAMKTDTLRSVEMRSNCLSKFHGRDIFLRAVVTLPPEYEKDEKRHFPAIYIVPGFGGSHFETAMYAGMLGKSETPFVRISLDSRCALGHHVYADSDNNGPYGRALIEEFIPWLEKEFRLIPEPYSRLLTGHSSGGWSTLWLQVSYPDYFGGTWSTSPDPVDFHDFTGVDIYDPKTNFFVDKDGEKRPIMRAGGEVRLWLPDFAKMEDTIGPGGQLHSFEAVFGPRGKDGNPVLLWDRKTGKIDPQVVKAWKRYDIVDKLQREWPDLGPKLKGKIFVLVGGEDTFYLEGAVKLLKDAMEKLGSDAHVEIVPGKDHGSIIFTPQFKDMINQMSKRFEGEGARIKKKG
jgi:S-formylglutathione hydrolase FrmB